MNQKLMAKRRQSHDNYPLANITDGLHSIQYKCPLRSSDYSYALIFVDATLDIYCDIFPEVES